MRGGLARSNALRSVCAVILALLLALAGLASHPRQAAAAPTGSMQWNQNGYVQSCGPLGCITIFSYTFNVASWFSAFVPDEFGGAWWVSSIQLEIYLSDPNGNIRACCGPLSDRRWIDIYDLSGVERYHAVGATEALCYDVAWDPVNQVPFHGCNRSILSLPNLGSPAGYGDYFAYVLPGSGVVGGWFANSGKQPLW